MINKKEHEMIGQEINKAIVRTAKLKNKEFIHFLKKILNCTPFREVKLIEQKIAELEGELKCS